jgi:carbonic anhydrase/acetyltransferase-like protein (isoleucine patch superfamily)
VPRFAFDGAVPNLANDVYLAPDATVLGQVVVGEQSSIWFGAVLRGDVGPIRIGRRTNVQDLCVLHMTGGVSVTELGDDVTIGHAVTLHGCRVGDRCLIGMGSIVMDHVEVGHESLVAAGSLLTPRLVVPPRSFVRGRPARVVRPMTDEEIANVVESARHYVDLARKYLDGAAPGVG